VKAGAELDLLVAQKVMGHVLRGGILQGPFGETYPYCPKYSVDSEQALRVLDRLTRLWGEFTLGWDGEDGCWVVYDQAKKLAACEQSFQVAVCKAALKAAGVEVQ